MSLKIKRAYEKDFVKFFILLFVVAVQLLYFVFVHGNLKLANDWQSIELTLSYSEYGFIRRGLIGELALRLAELFGFELSYNYLSYFVLFFLLVFTVAVSVFFWFIIKSSETEEKNIVFLLLLLFVVFGGISFYFCDWAEPDIYMILLTLVSAVCVIKDRFLFLIPVNCALCTMIHEGYPMMFFIIIMSMLFYKWLSKEKTAPDKYFYTILFSGLVTSVLFVYFYFFSKINDNITLDYMHKRALDLTFVEQKQNLEYLFFNGSAPKYGFWVDGRPTRYFFRNIINVVLNIILYSPVLFVLYRIQKRTVLKCGDVKEKIKYIVLFAGFSFVIPLFVCHTDTGRWMMDFWIYEFLLFAFLIITKDEKFIDSIHSSITNRKILVFVPVYFIIGLSMDKEQINSMTASISSNLVDTAMFFIGSAFH